MDSRSQIYYMPNFSQDCRLCGTAPTVNVLGHKVPETQLCGTHFFDDKDMKHWEDWNEKKGEEK